MLWETFGTTRRRKILGTRPKEVQALPPVALRLSRQGYAPLRWEVRRLVVLFRQLGVAE